MTGTGEKVWQSEFGGLEEQLRRADQMEQQGDVLGAHVLRASAYYSHFPSRLRPDPLGAFTEFWLAKQCCQQAIDWMAVNRSNITHGQCDVLGTLLLRGWLWIKPDLLAARIMFQRGLNSTNVPMHSRALMTIGLAEICYLLKEYRNCIKCIDMAIVYTQQEVLDGDNTSMLTHKRQCCRVWRRAAVLMHKLGKRQVAQTYWNRALADAAHPIWGSKDQLNKIQRERLKLRWLWWSEWLLPH